MLFLILSIFEWVSSVCLTFELIKHDVTLYFWINQTCWIMPCNWYLTFTYYCLLTFSIQLAIMDCGYDLLSFFELWNWSSLSFRRVPITHAAGKSLCNLFFLSTLIHSFLLFDCVFLINFFQFPVLFFLNRTTSWWGLIFKVRGHESKCP